MSYFRAVATDLDGTLASDGQLAPGLVDALRTARATAVRLVLVTGRILSELREAFPGLEDEFDVVVAENGGVLSVPRGVVDLAAAPDGRLVAALRRRGVAVRRGRVVLACDGEHEPAVEQTLAEWEGAYQITRNRGALMVLPSGVTKGSGVAAGLDELGVSPHSTIAVGDAENDDSLLAVCEVGMAVGDAVASLKAQADRTLPQADGVGVRGLLESDLVLGTDRFPPSRWRIPLGRAVDGKAVDLPGSQLNLLVTGGTLAGKSFIGGMICEHLVAAGYTVVVFDLEGDHAVLGQLPGMALLGGLEEAPPAPEQLEQVVRNGSSSAIVDVSLLSPLDKHRYVTDAVDHLAALRTVTGRPHWYVIEEAHHAVQPGAVQRRLFDDPARGVLLVTFRPWDLPNRAREAMDAATVVPGRGVEPDETAEILSDLTGASAGHIDEALARLESGEALLAHRGQPDLVRYRVGSRSTTHVRHQRKYADGSLPPSRGFHFRLGPDHRHEASSVRDFHGSLQACDVDVFAFHAARGDFSRWISQVLQDRWLATAATAIEQVVQAGEDPRPAQERLAATVSSRYDV